MKFKHPDEYDSEKLCRVTLYLKSTPRLLLKLELIIVNMVQWWVDSDFILITNSIVIPEESCTWENGPWLTFQKRKILTKNFKKNIGIWGILHDAPYSLD